MIPLWLFDIALTVLEWTLLLFSFLPSFVLPAPFTLVVPIPFIGADGVAAVNQWFETAVVVTVALVIGKVLQWMYDRIPFKGT